MNHLGRRTIIFTIEELRQLRQAIEATAVGGKLDPAFESFLYQIIYLLTAPNDSRAGEKE